MPRSLSVVRRIVVLLLLLAAVAVAVALIGAGQAAQASNVAAASQPSKGTAATLDPASAQGKAWAWILSQRGSGTTVTSASSIAAAQSYSADWTGAVSGTFTPRGVTSPITDAASVVVDSPAKVGGDYAGSISGHIALAPSAGRWIVQVYRDTESGRVQVPLQTLVAANGSFSLDLGSVASPPAGTWALGLLDAQNSYAPTGTPWPAGTYADWEVRAYVVTDAAYLVGHEPADADGTFSFPSSQPGTKVFQLVDRATGDVLAEQAPDFGLIRSFAGGTRVYTYDQALAVITAVDLDGDAGSLTAGLISLQDSDGGFLESADVRNPAAGTAIVRTGISAIATYALLRQLQTMDASDQQRPAVLAAARAGLTWLLAQRRSDGLLGAGRGDYDSDGSLDATAVPTWVSTEQNIDAWQTLTLASTVLDDSSYSSDASALDAAIVGTLWNAANARFQEGVNADGTPDNTDPLDVSSWGTLFLLDAGHPGLAAQAAAHMNAFASSADGTGYRAYYPQNAFPNAPQNVWVEGSAGVAIARARIGDAQGAAQDLAHLAALQSADGSFAYATRSDTATSMTTQPSVTATAWFLLASIDPSGDATIW